MFGVSKPPLSHSRSWIDCGVASPDYGTNTTLRDGRAGTTNGASSSEESIRVKSWWMAPPTTAGPSLRTLRLRRGPGFFAALIVVGAFSTKPAAKVSSPDNSSGKSVLSRESCPGQSETPPVRFSKTFSTVINHQCCCGHALLWWYLVGNVVLQQSTLQRIQQKWSTRDGHIANASPDTPALCVTVNISPRRNELRFVVCFQPGQHSICRIFRSVAPPGRAWM